MKVRTRMMIAFLVAGLCALVYLIHFIEAKLKPVYLDPIEDDLVEMATFLSSSLVLSSTGGGLNLERMAATLDHATGRELNAVIYGREKNRVDLHVYITDASGVVRYDSRDNHMVGRDQVRWNDISRTLQGLYGARATWDRSGDRPRLYLYVASPIRVDGRLIGVVSVGKPTPSVAFPILQKMREEAFLGVYAGVGVALALAVLFTIWVTRPIRTLTEYTRALKDGRSVAPPRLGSSDIGELGRSFEAMRDALEGKKYVEQYVQTLTHEIKSPLSAIRGSAELLDEDLPADRHAGFVANIRTEANRIQRIVERLLELSAIESRRQPRNIEPIRLDTLVEDILASADPMLQTKKITVDLRLEGRSRVRGERFLIRQALANLIQNAIDFTPVAGHIEILIIGGDITIRDSGPGIPDYALERVFDRFYSLRRPDSGKKSSGLGLSIVKGVAGLHGAEVSLKNNTDGGARAMLRFPNEALVEDHAKQTSSAAPS